MKVKRIILQGVICGFLIGITTTKALGAPTLLGIRNGEQGDKAWAVLSFDQKALWTGISKGEDHQLNLYFWGSAGSVDGTTLDVNTGGQTRITTTQMSQDPQIFKVEINSNKQMPVLVARNNRYVVVNFNQLDDIQDKVTGAGDISVTPGKLLSVKSLAKGESVTTMFDFDGSYDIIGFEQNEENAASIYVDGAMIATQNNVYEYANSGLKSIRLLPSNLPENNFRVDVSFEDDVLFNIAKTAKKLLVKTQRPVMQIARQTEHNQAPALSAFSDDDPLQDARLQALFEDDTAPAMSQPAPTAAKVESNPYQPQTPVYQPIENTAKVVTVSQSGIPWNRQVSFRFHGTPIKNALRLLATSNNLNMVIGEKVDGSVTMNLENVTLKQALDKIVHTHNCEYILEDNIITVKPVSVAFEGGRVTKVYHLKYADATNVASVIRKVVSSDSLVEVFHPEFLYFEKAGLNRMESNKVGVQGIRRSSILVVTDRPEKIKEVDRVIASLDIQSVQIMIESKLVEASPQSVNKIGIDWDKTITAMLKNEDVLSGGSTNSYSMLNSSPERGGDFRLGHLTASEFSAVLDFLNEKTDSKLISNPKLLAMDNEESSISVGTTVPIPKLQRGTSGQGDMVTFDYKEVNIQLNVTPHLSDNGEITMYVNPVIEEISGWVEYEGNSAPITNKRSVNSIVSVANGETIVIGGMIKSQKVKTTKKVWMLGSLPLLGKLFEHEDYQDVQTELMIFITPSVVQD